MVYSETWILCFWRYPLNEFKIKEIKICVEVEIKYIQLIVYYIESVSS